MGPFFMLNYMKAHEGLILYGKCISFMEIYQYIQCLRIVIRITFGLKHGSQWGNNHVSIFSIGGFHTQ